MDSKNFKVGDKVWFWDFGTDQPDSGIVVKIDKCVKPLTSDLSPYAKLQIDDSIFVKDISISYFQLKKKLCRLQEITVINI